MKQQNFLVKVIEKIEENGGSVRFQWIPGHITEGKVNQYSHAFSAENGAVDNNLVEQYTLGNNASDVLAGSTTRKSDFRELKAPKVESASELREKAEDKYSERSQNNNPLC